MINRHFRSVVIKNDFTDNGKPILLIGNHFSWWDGFFANYLNIKIFKRKFHVMMLEEQLQNRMFLNKAGAYSIRKHSHSVKESLAYTRNILSDSENLVTLFPQGEIRSMFQFPVRFERGITQVLNGLEGKVRVVFMAALIDYFSHRKPSLTLGLKEYIPGESIDLQNMEDTFNDYLKEMIAQQKEQ
jgi:hypothetical protein